MDDVIEPNGPDFQELLRCTTTPNTSATTAPTSTLVIGKGRPDVYATGDTRVPSVTEVLDDWHPGGVDALCQWAHNTALGSEKKAPSHWRVERDTAGDFGTAMHDYSLKLDIGEDADDLARLAEAQWNVEGVHAFREYERFKRQVQPSYSHAEITLISERYEYGGTFDRRERDGTVGDLKGSKAPRITMVAQLGGYAELLREHGYGWPPRGWLFHFPRTLVDANGKARLYQHHVFDGATLLRGRDAFLRILDAHRDALEIHEAIKASTRKRRKAA